MYFRMKCHEGVHVHVNEEGHTHKSIEIPIYLLPICALYLPKNTAWHRTIPNGTTSCQNPRHVPSYLKPFPGSMPVILKQLLQIHARCSAARRRAHAEVVRLRAEPAPSLAALRAITNQFPAAEPARMPIARAGGAARSEMRAVAMSRM